MRLANSQLPFGLPPALTAFEALPTDCPVFQKDKGVATALLTRVLVGTTPRNITVFVVHGAASIGTDGVDENQKHNGGAKVE